MGKFLSGTGMKWELQQVYGERIVICNDVGKSDFITLKRTANEILREFFEKPKNVDIKTQKQNIIDVVASLLKNDIKDMLSQKDEYVSPHFLTEVDSLIYLPRSLETLLSKLFVGKKQAKENLLDWTMYCSGCKAKRNYFTLTIGLAVQMHTHFRSRYIVDTLHTLGFCSSLNNEVQIFERNATVSSCFVLKRLIKGDSTFVFVADNVDHNIQTLDGKDTFHGMGMTAAIGNGNYGKIELKRANVGKVDILSRSSVKVIEYQHRNITAIKSTFKNLPSIYPSQLVSNIDILWQTPRFFDNPIPNWLGYMQMICEKQSTEIYNKSDIYFLPIIDLSPSDLYFININIFVRSCFKMLLLLISLYFEGINYY